MIVCDTGNRSVRVISNGKPFKELSAVIYPYAQLFNLVKLENVLNELGASDLLSQVRLMAMVTLMVENVLSLMRKDDPMPTQLEYES